MKNKTAGQILFEKEVVKSILLRGWTWEKLSDKGRTVWEQRAARQWQAIDISNPIEPSGMIEFEVNGEWHDFSVVTTATHLVFGGACNVGLLQSGYIEREEGETLDETLSELLADLECYYRDGAQYVSRIVVNDRM